MKNKRKNNRICSNTFSFFLFFYLWNFRSNSKEEKVDDSIFVETSSKINKVRKR